MLLLLSWLLFATKIILYLCLILLSLWCLSLWWRILLNLGMISNGIGSMICHRLLWLEPVEIEVLIWKKIQQILNLLISVPFLYAMTDQKYRNYLQCCSSLTLIVSHLAVVWWLGLRHCYNKSYHLEREDREKSREWRVSNYSRGW